MEFPITKLKQDILCTCHFLKDVLPLANAHNNDFFVEGLWERFFPDHLQHELLSAESKGVSSLNDHLSFDRDCLTHCCKKDVQLQACENEYQEGCEKPQWNKKLNPCWTNIASISDFVRMAIMFSIARSDHVIKLEDLFSRINCDSQKLPHVKQGMSEKKSHEVEHMVAVCGKLLHLCNLNQVSFCFLGSIKDLLLKVHMCFWSL